VCLPVPICAASGLSLPLPATVERIAASLVPWADGVSMSANEALRAGVRGTILADPDERTRNGVDQSRFATAATPHASTSNRTRVMIPRPGAPNAWPESRDDPVPAVPAGTPDAGGRAGPVGDAGSAPLGSAESSGPAPAPSETTPSEPSPTEPDPIVEPIVEDVIAPVNEVLEPVAPVIEDTAKTVDETIEPVTGILPGLGK
jgi:hypothetical protein